MDTSLEEPSTARARPSLKAGLSDGDVQLLPHAGRRNNGGRTVLRAEAAIDVCCDLGIRGDTACNPQLVATSCGVDRRVQGGQRHDQDHFSNSLQPNMYGFVSLSMAELRL